jgi:hypothetical protein
MNLIKQGKWGMWLSGLCAIHCMLTPLVVVALPYAGFTVHGNHTFEYILLMFSFIFALTTTLRSYLKVHHQFSVVLCMLSGFAIVVFGHLSFSGVTETILSVTGSALIIYSLFKNQSLLKSCRCA